MEEKFKEIIPVTIGYVKYCPYCGEKAIIDTYWEDYNEYTDYLCDCEGAQIQSKIKALKEDLEKFIDNFGKPVLNKIHFKVEVSELRTKYDQ